MLGACSRFKSFTIAVVISKVREVGGTPVLSKMFGGISVPQPEMEDTNVFYEVRYETDSGGFIIYEDLQSKATCFRPPPLDSLGAGDCSGLIHSRRCRSLIGDYKKRDCKADEAPGMLPQPAAPKSQPTYRARWLTRNWK